MRGLLFLDIDGVLNSREMFIERKDIPVPGNLINQTVSKEAVGLLKELVVDLDLRLVITSAWRSTTMDDFKDRFVDGCLVGNQAVINALNHSGWRGCANYIVGSTRRLSTGCRGDEIYEWLVTHSRYTHTPYVIVDDDSDMLTSQLGRLVNVNNEVGLIEADIIKIRSLLA